MANKKTNLLNRNWFQKATLEDVLSEINNGADVNAVDKYGWRPLMFAIQYRWDGKAIKSLIEVGAMVNVMACDGTTPLMLAALCDGTNVIDVLIEHGANIEAKDNAGNTPLMYAIKYNPEGVKILLKHGANINIKNALGEAPINKAAISVKQREIIKILTEVGIDINDKNKDFDDATPLMVACISNENPQMIKTLIDLGADINAVDNKKMTALMYAASHTKNPDIIKVLVASGLDVNAKDEDGKTALMYAVWFNENIEITKALIELRADIDAKNNSGKSVIDFAKKNKNTEILHFIESNWRKAMSEGNAILDSSQINVIERLISCATTPGIINIDTSDIQELLKYGKNLIYKCVIIKHATKEDVEKSGLLCNELHRAHKYLINVESGENMSLEDLNTICDTIHDFEKSAYYAFTSTYDKYKANEFQVELFMVR